MIKSITNKFKSAILGETASEFANRHGYTWDAYEERFKVAIMDLSMYLDLRQIDPKLGQAIQKYV